MLRSKRRLVALGSLVLLIVTLMTGTAWAAGDPAISEAGKAIATTVDVGVAVNLLWIVIGAVLVIFMQAGFALVETGFCRAKHAAHVVSTNFAVFGLGFVAFFLVGFPLMFGGYSYAGYFGLDMVAECRTSLIGFGDWMFLWGRPVRSERSRVQRAVAAFFLYMVAFMDTTATIPTGAMAERWKWKAFVGWGLFCGAIYYPLFGGVDLGRRLARQLGEQRRPRLRLRRLRRVRRRARHGWHRCVWPVRSCSGPASASTEDGKPRALAGHNIPMAMLGTFILLFGWFGFNAASTLRGDRRPLRRGRRQHGDRGSVRQRRSRCSTR